MDISEFQSPPVAMTIAGLDPSGGAGVIADIKTFSAFGCFGVAAITSLTYQNTTGVFGASHQSADIVRAQVLPLIQDFEIRAVKTGMLPSREVIEEVARLLRQINIQTVVVDPVVRSTSGYDLIDEEALQSLTKSLLPLARVVTPNVPEAERITGIVIRDEDDMLRAASKMRDMGARAVLVKGGHLSEDRALDLLDDAGTVNTFASRRIESTSTHGTGCTLSAGIAACLARGMELKVAVGAAKRFVTDAIRHAPNLGHGHGPINHSVPVRLDAHYGDVEKQ